MDGSFESTAGGSWALDAGYHASAATFTRVHSTGQDGNWYGQLSTTAAPSGLTESVSAASIAVGDTYTFSMWVKSDDASTYFGSLAVWATTGGGLGEAGSKGFWVGPTWSLVSASVEITVSGHTGFKVDAFTNDGTGRKLDVDDAQLQDAGLANASFATGDESGWTLNAPAGVTAAWAVYKDVHNGASAAFDGTDWMEMHGISSGGSYASVSQTQSVSPAPTVGWNYTFSAWVRSPDGIGLSGSLNVQVLGGGGADTASSGFTAGNSWQLVEATVPVTFSGHTTIYVQLYSNDTTGRNLDISGTQLQNACLGNAGFELASPTYWGTSSATLSDVAGAGYDGARYGKATATANIGYIDQIQNIPSSLGQTFVFSVWVRSHSGAALSGSLAFYAIGGSGTEGTGTAFVATSSWQFVSVPMNVSMASHTSVDDRIYVNPSGGVLDVDGASLANGNQAGLQSPVPPGQTQPPSGFGVGTVVATPGDQLANLSWTNAAGVGGTATSFTVTPYIGVTAQTPINVGNHSTYTVTGLTNGTTYTFSVYGSDAAGNGGNSTSAPMTPAAPPSAPTSPVAVAGNGQATLSWGAPTQINGSQVTGYVVTPSVGSTVLEAMAVGKTPTSFTVPNLANGASYSFTVAAVNAAGTGPAALTGAAVPGLPGAPSGVSPVSTNGAATVSWTAPTSAGAAAVTGYVVTPYIGATAQAPATFWNAATTETVAGLTDGTAYTFAVQAINPFGTGAAASSASSTPAAVVPSAPSTVSAVAGDTQAVVSWAAPASSGGAPVTGYTVTPYISGVAQATLPAASSPSTVTGLTDGTLYTFTVKATNAVGNGPESAPSWNVLPAAAPVTTTVAVSVAPGTGTGYQQGGTALYAATVSTSSVSAVSETLLDTLPPEESGLGAAITVNGSACGGGVTCTGTPTTILVTGLSVAAGSPAAVAYSVVVTGTTRQSAALTDSAVATISGGNSAAGSATFTVNDNGLGVARWWTFTTQALGALGTAHVNVANGNLVVTQQDAIPMKLRGALSFDLRRTYNSQAADSLGMPQLFGPNWSYSFTDAGSDVGGVGIGVPPSQESYASSAPVTLTDGTGARSLFTPSPLASVVDVGALSTSGVLATVIPTSLPLGSGFNDRCVDEQFLAPTGVHVSMWRYLETSGSTCAGLGSATTQVIGYATVGVDRVRREFNAAGQLLSIRDAAGNEVDYTYNGSQQLTAVTEAGTGRSFAITYVSAGETDITDPGGEVTRYFFTSSLLTSVINPGPTAATLGYVYSGAGCNNASYQVCAFTDSFTVNALPVVETTAVTYAAAAVGPPQVATWTDRKGNSSTMTYVSAATTTADRVDGGAQQLHERSQYTGIDGAGRVGELDQGTTAGSWLTSTLYGWDTAASTCRQPEAVVDNDLCSIIRRAVGGVSDPGNADRVTYYGYSDEGRMLAQNDLDWPQTEATTAAYQAQYVEADGTVATFADSVAGSGTVTTPTRAGGRQDGNTLFDVATQTQSLSPRGNAAGGSYALYQTTYKVDNAPAGVSINSSGGASLCVTPASPSADTGLVCEADQPQYDSVGHAGSLTTTQYTYNSLGERISMTTPKAVAEGLGTYRFTYYGSGTAGDLSRTTVSDGWLQGITDPAGNFVAFAYDAEGHQVRSWDRDATAGTTLASYPGTPSAPAAPAYAATLYTTGSDTSGTTYSSPGRSVLATRDATGASWTTDIVDANGNVLGVRSPNGTSASPTSTPVCPQPSTGQTFDTCSSYDANDNLTQTLRPLEANTANWTPAVQHPATRTYDAFDNAIAAVDGNGHVTATLYDQANRRIGILTARGVTTPSTALDYVASAPGAGCYAKGSAPGWVYDGAMPANSMDCVVATSYDGVGNVVAATDANGHTAQSLFDAAHHQTQTITPRADGSFVNLVTVRLYDADGHLTDVCSPRELSEGGIDLQACTSTATYATHTTYNPMGLAVSATVYRIPGTSETTTTAFDADGNALSITDPTGAVTTNLYDVLDHLASTAIPRDATHAYPTTFTYDPSGHKTVTQVPVSGTAHRITDTSYDADGRPLDTVSGASSANIGTTTVYSSTNGTDVRTRTQYDADGNVILTYPPDAFQAPGTLASPNRVYEQAAQYSADDTLSASYSPRYDTVSLPVPAAANAGTQTSQCPGATTLLQGAPYQYAATTGICTTTYAYDPAGNRVTVNWPTRGTNQSTTYNLFDDNLVALRSDPSPVTSGQQVTAATYLYDGDGHQTRVTDALSLSSATTYTADELVASQTRTPNGATTHVTTSVYDADGNPISAVDATGATTTMAYTADGLKAASTDGAGDRTSYTYDSVGNLSQVKSPSANAGDATNPQGLATHNYYSYDNLLTETDVPTSTTTQAARQTCYGYDQGGLKTQEFTITITTLGSTATCPTAMPGSGGFTSTYGLDGRPATQVGSNNSLAASTIASTYDAAGGLTVATTTGAAAATITPTYYADGLTATVVDGNGRTLSYAYDGAGKLVERSQTGGAATEAATYTYNDAELLASMAPSGSGLSTLGTTSFGYQENGMQTTQTNGNGTAETTSYAVDGSVAEKKTVKAGTTVSDFTQLVDKDFRATSVACTTCAGLSPASYDWRYSYDGAGRLVTQGGSTVALQVNSYDHDGNRTISQSVLTATPTTSAFSPDDTTATVSAPNSAPLSTLYSAPGDMTSDGCKTYSHDAFNRIAIVAAQGGAPASCGTTASTTSTYDSLNRHQTQVSAGVTTSLVPDGLNSAVAVEWTPTVQTAYMLTPDGRPTGLVTATSSPEWLSQNIQGSVATTTTSTGTSKCQLQYDPYGALLFSLTPTNVCESGSTASDLLYNSDRRDPTTGTYQLGARNYDPTKNGFLEPDGFASGQPAQDVQLQSDPLTRNVYGYVNGDPVNYFDPTGHNPCAYEEGGCSSVMNKALAASDRGADISGVSSHTTTHRTYHSPVRRTYTVMERHEIAANGSGADVAQAAWLASQAADAQARANSSQIQSQIRAQDQAGSQVLAITAPPDNLAQRAARYLFMGIFGVDPGPTTKAWAVTKSGVRIGIPEGWTATETESGGGLLFRPPDWGRGVNSSEIRLMPAGSNDRSNTEVMIRNRAGNYLNENLTGATSKSEWHIQVDDSGNPSITRNLDPSIFEEGEEG